MGVVASSVGSLAFSSAGIATPLANRDLQASIILTDNEARGAMRGVDVANEEDSASAAIILVATARGTIGRLTNGSIEQN